MVIYQIFYQYYSIIDRISIFFSFILCTYSLVRLVDSIEWILGLSFTTYYMNRKDFGIVC